ncbi:4Fe-4S dicluster domain-containing protein [[Eubacterium] cellulosolvens]
MAERDQELNHEQFEAKNSLFKVKDGLINSVNDLFKNILEKTEVGAILVPKKLPAGAGFIPALVTHVEALNEANALAPIMPVNASKAVSDYSRLKPSKHLVAVVLKPCEQRAVVELAKLKQINLENVLIIGIDCPGTYSIQDYSESNDKSKLNSDSLIKTISKLEDHPKLRTACLACEHFAPKPDATDIIIGLYGLEPTRQYLVRVNSPLAEATLEPLQLYYDTKDAQDAVKKRNSAVEKLTARRLNATKELEESTHDRIYGLENFMDELSACINCHNCMEVCPICYCRECFFDSPTFNLEADKYFKIANRKGSLRMPANMFLFHVTRFNHMVLSCIACGMCEQGCPANIPLLSIYKTVGRNAQNVFDYEPGRSLEEEIPILTFKEDELEPK